MIQVHPGGWLHLEEIAMPVPGREDPPDLIQRCVAYLERRHSARGGKAVHKQDVLVRASIIAAQIQASTGTATSVPRDVAELKKTVAEQDATIDLLLARIPGRVLEIAPQILEALRERVAQWTIEFFGSGKPVAVEIAPERESEACHRLVVHVPVKDGLSPEDFVAAEFALRRRVAGSLRPEEFRAVELIVVPVAS